MKALWNGQVLAESPQERLIYIEGNWYFPPDSLNKEFFKPSDMTTHCPWKGDASYYTVMTSDSENVDAAWYYPAPQQSAIDTVKKDFTNYVAFWRGVEVKE